MVVITGLRSGTSFLMQMLERLGYHVIGDKFNDDFYIEELNPNGYYQLPEDEVINGLNCKIYSGCVVKLIGICLQKTEPKFIKKIIWCRRNPEKAIESVYRFLKAYNYPAIEATMENAKLVYNSNNAITYEYFKNNNVPRLDVYYEEMCLNNETVLKKIIEFLGKEI